MGVGGFYYTSPPPVSPLKKRVFGLSERGDGTMSEIFLGKIFRYPKMTPKKK
jgi:hypothetical protein